MKQQYLRAKIAILKGFPLADKLESARPDKGANRAVCIHKVEHSWTMKNRALNLDFGQPPHDTLYGVFESRAKTNPGDIAIEVPGRAPLDFKRLRQLINETLSSLNQAGIGRGDRVAMVLPNGPEMAAAFLAVGAAATCAPLNPGYRRSEFEFFLSDLNAKALLIQAGMDSPSRDVAAEKGIPVIELAPELEAPAGVFSLRADIDAAASHGGPASAEDIALVLHTSGTTSRPKIVPLSHRNICTSAHNIGLTLGLSSKDRCLNVMPLFHIHGLIAGVLSSLAAGGRTICMCEFSAPEFFEMMQNYRPTWYSAVPTIHQTLLSRLEEHRHLVENHQLRFIRSSSAALPPQVMSDLEQAFGVPVLESYGMTEAAHQMASNPLPPQKRKPGSAGIAAGPDVAIMDEQGNLLDSGETGEIVIRGGNITKGYEGNEQANAEAFTNGWFRTGDQGYLDNEGYLFITGRLKEIINRGGEKVSPREIDEVLLSHPEVAQAVAFAVPHPSLGEDIAAAVILKDGTELTAPALREYLFGKIADYKIPSQLLIVNEIPKGPTGKIQRIGLAEKFTKALQHDYIAPESDLEKTIVDIFKEILDIEKVSMNENFFALGGDSIRATQAVARIRTAFQIEIPIITLFRKPTVEELAAEVARLMESNDGDDLTDILAELENLSDEEAERLLNDLDGGAP